MTMLLRLCLALIAAAPALSAVPAYDRPLKARVFERAWTLVDTHYWNRAGRHAAWTAARDRFRARVLDAPDRQHFYALLGEMLASLGDSHVYAIDPLQIAIGKARDAGKPAEGFGLDLRPDDQGVWRVANLRADSAAVRAGVQIGWELRSLDGRPFDIDYEPAEGEKADFRFVDEHGTVHAVRLVAHDEPSLPPRRATRLPGNILLLGLDGFDPGADRWARRAIGAAAPAGLILDLRSNDGGDADVIARVAGIFFARNRPLVERIAARATTQMTRGAGPDAYTGPLALLIGHDSASGAEALAALVDESKRGVTIGEQSAGALTGAAYYPLPDGGQLAVAEFDIRTPGGARLEGKGVTPIIPVAPTLADRRAGRDPVLDRARQWLAAQRTRREAAGGS